MGGVFWGDFGGGVGGGLGGVMQLRKVRRGLGGALCEGLGGWGEGDSWGLGFAGGLGLGGRAEKGGGWGWQGFGEVDRGQKPTQNAPQSPIFPPPFNETNRSATTPSACPRASPTARATAPCSCFARPRVGGGGRFRGPPHFVPWAAAALCLWERGPRLPQHPLAPPKRPQSNAKRCHPPPPPTLPPQASWA